MASKSARLNKHACKAYFDELTKQLEGKEAYIEVGSLSLGNQVESEWTRLLGIAYDPKSDLVEIDLEGLDHLIEHPKDIRVGYDHSGVQAIEIVDADDAKQIVRLREPLQLPAPAGSP
ncbi:MAG TPA: DUF5335 family protein [Gammaproteobacteria bacterium]|nr:DUF5335 family protein [Gammaproteobacteria bacterium]